MLYVAGEILIWMVLAGLLGLAVGWFLWGYRSKGEAEKADRERQQEVAAAQQQATVQQAHVQELLALRARDTETIARLQAVAAATDAAKGTDASQMAGLRQRVADLEAQLADSQEERAEAEQRADAAEEILEEHEGWEPVGEIPGMAEAHRLLGKPVILDDLKVVEGVGPKIEEVLHGAGIATWAQLATATPDRLRAALDAAGPELSAHDPTTWPQQANLALGGHWEALKELQDHVRGGQA
jgi:predicted flap endonuclease-1-like 5' DNA nuclease